MCQPLNSYSFYKRPEKKHDYHIMLSPTIKERASTVARDKKKSLSSYIECALIQVLNDEFKS